MITRHLSAVKNVYARANPGDCHTAGREPHSSGSEKGGGRNSPAVASMVDSTGSLKSATGTLTGFIRPLTSAQFQLAYRFY